MRPRGGSADQAPSSPPPGLDWDLWLGPAPYVAYNQNRCFYKFRWFRNYSGGQLTNMGTHYLDLIQWAIGKEAPASVVAVGGNYAVDDNRDVPDTMEVIWEYPEGPLVTFTQINGNGAKGTPMGDVVEIRGTKGTIYCAGGGLDVLPEVVMDEAILTTGPIQRATRKKQSTHTVGKTVHEKNASEDETTLHARNFLDCVKSRKPTNCPVDIGHRSTTTTLLGVIAQQRKKVLMWDARREQFTNDPDANELLSYEYRAPWNLPPVSS